MKINIGIEITIWITKIYSKIEINIKKKKKEINSIKTILINKKIIKNHKYLIRTIISIHLFHHQKLTHKIHHSYLIHNIHKEKSIIILVPISNKIKSRTITKLEISKNLNLGRNIESNLNL